MGRNKFNYRKVRRNYLRLRGFDVLGVYLPTLTGFHISEEESTKYVHIKRVSISDLRLTCEAVNGGKCTVRRVVST